MERTDGVVDPAIEVRVSTEVFSVVPRLGVTDVGLGVPGVPDRMATAAQPGMPSNVPDRMTTALGPEVPADVPDRMTTSVRPGVPAPVPAVLGQKWRSHWHCHHDHCDPRHDPRELHDEILQLAADRPQGPAGFPLLQK